MSSLTQNFEINRLLSFTMNNIDLKTTTTHFYQVSTTHMIC